MSARPSRMALSTLGILLACMRARSSAMPSSSSERSISLHRGPPHFGVRIGESEVAMALRSALRRRLLVVMRVRSSGAARPAGLQRQRIGEREMGSRPSVMNTWLSALR